MTKMYEFEDGTMVSDIVIDIELERKKGRVTREEAFDLARVANEIRKERDELNEVVEKQHALILKSYSVIKGLQSDLQAVKKAQSKRDRKKAANLKSVN